MLLEPVYTTTACRLAVTAVELATARCELSEQGWIGLFYVTEN